MITRIQKSEMLGDCTVWYQLDLDREYTVSEFINETKNLDNYANYHIYVRKWAETKIAESSYGRVKHFGGCNMKIISAEANGGYGLMGYYIKV